MRTLRRAAMSSIILSAFALCSVLMLGACARASDATQGQEVVPLERAALDRWGKGDPGGLLETYAPEITYFDSNAKTRIDGHAAMTEYYRPLPGKIQWTKWEMIDPAVQQHGAAAVLTYRLHTEFLAPDGKEAERNWNSTSVYARIGGEWKMVHSHWSLTALPAVAGIM